jgi:hypothetical protein
MVYFQTKNPNLEKNLEALAMEFVGIFNVHLGYFIAILYILWLFGIFALVLVCCCKKNLATVQGRLGPGLETPY